MALPARTQPLGLYSQYVSKAGDELLIQEKMASLSGDSFRIQTTSGQPVVQVQGNSFSLSGRKNVSDLQGNALFDIRKEHFKLHSTYYCENPKGEKILQVKSKWGIGSSRAIITFNNVLGGGTPVELEMKGDFLSRKAEIIDNANGQPIAAISKKSFNARNIFTDQDTYIVTIAAGVDIAIVVAMCVCFDEKNNEQ